WQPLSGHSREVAELAAVLAAKFGAEKAAKLAGWLHDLGKYSNVFQDYISGRVTSGGDHSTAGAFEVMQLGLKDRERQFMEAVAYIIAGHHAGLPDKTSKTGAASGLNERLKAYEGGLDEIWREEIAFDATGLSPERFQLGARRPFQMAFLTRMIFSCVVDADFLNTEDFYARVKGKPIDRVWPQLRSEIDRLIAAFDAQMAVKRREAVDTALNRLRGDILDHVRGKATLPRGVFTLNVPTGGGKTLASLGFALDHAKHWNMERIVYAIPFTSIIEQSAAIFCEVIGHDVVLEHHASIGTAGTVADHAFDDGRGENKLRMAMENWLAPVIVTTNVQLFESLFASRTSRCRKLHNLANAVIILDEAQTIPLPVLRPCVAALDELARNYGCTIVLCTATQPALIAPSCGGNFEGGFEIGPERELAPDPLRLHRELKRTTQRHAGVMTDAELVAEFSASTQGLIIVNSRQHALLLYWAGQAARLDGLIHLTTRQTAADRRIILKRVRDDLTAGRPCRVVATSLIEAGVDVDFPQAWRAQAGIDQMMQAAGRINREGKRPVAVSILTIFKPAEAKPPVEIAGLIDDSGRALSAMTGADMFSPRVIEAYFREVYWRKDAGLDKHNVMGAFGIHPLSGGTDFPFRSVAEKFRLIESGMAPVIIARDDAAKAVLAALKGGLPPGRAARGLQSHVVQVPPRDFQKLLTNGHVRYVEGFGDQFAVLMHEELYTPEVGLNWEDADELTTSQSII
ncbi:MAG: CRISPR-associated endonuclease Cas3'', partial [Nitrobacter sp.]